MSDFLTRYEGLSTEHLAELNLMSAINEKQIRSRYYQSVTADKLPPQFADYQRRDGLLIPIRTVRGEIESFQLKPNQPRIGKNGKPIKYETAANAPQVIDVPVSAVRHLGDPKMPLVITEGAKKVDAAVSAGLVTTIGLQGVYGWRGKNAQGGTTALADWEAIALNDRQVLIAFDSDVMTKASVRDALDRLANFLRSKKAKPCFLTMPDLSDGKKCGLDDWFALGKTKEQLMEHIVAELPPVMTAQASSTGNEAPSAGSPETNGTGIPHLVTVSIADIEEKQVDWLWPGWLPRGMLTLLGGYAGDGKSTLTTALAATFSTGGALPDGAIAPTTGTLMVVTEDDVSHVVKGRLTVHGVDQHRVSVLKHVSDGQGGQRAFNLRTDVPLLRDRVEKDDIGLVVIDPLSSVLGSGDRNNEGEVRDTMAPLLRMMEETGVAVIGIMHIGKNDGHAKAFQKLMGSTAFSALARCIWMVHELPEEHQVPGEPTRKLIDVTKSNIAIAPPPIQFCRPQDAAVQFLGESPLRFDEASKWRKSPDRDEKAPTERDKAAEWLLEFMNGKRVLASAVEAAAKEEGMNHANVKKAKVRIGLKSQKEGKDWYWLPPEAENVA